MNILKTFLENGGKLDKVVSESYFPMNIEILGAQGSHELWRKRIVSFGVLLPWFFPKSYSHVQLREKASSISCNPWPEAHSEDWNHWEGALISLLVACYQFSGTVLFPGSRTNLRRIRYRTLSLPVYLPNQSPREFLFFTSLYF